jgi:thymidylate kinase
MKSKHIFVSLDGVDGVGKTTVAKLLASNSSFQYYKSPAGPFAQLRKEVDAHATPLERYCFYRLATQFNSTRITQLLEVSHVICDRYIASTAAYHIAMDARIRAIHDEAGLLKPHFAFLLGTRSEIRDKRLIECAKISSDIEIERNSTFLDRVAEIFMSFGLIYIDTSDITAEEVVETIRHTVAQGKGTL